MVDSMVTQAMEEFDWWLIRNKKCTCRKKLLSLGVTNNCYLYLFTVARSSLCFPDSSYQEVDNNIFLDSLNYFDFLKSKNSDLIFYSWSGTI